MLGALRLALAGALVLALALAGLIVLGATIAGGTGGTGGADAASGTRGAGGSSAPRELLPDLVARAPTKVSVQTRGRQHRLVFASAASNLGRGPLEVLARRADTSTPWMTADQVVARSDGSDSRVTGVGRLQYVFSSDHQHWHFLHFMRYSLRRHDGGRTVLRDRKTGFCLGDRYDTGRSLPNKPRTAFYRGGCGYRQRYWLTMQQGISVGFGDNYRPELEGQFLVLNGLPAGRYLLVHTIDTEGRFRELTRANNTSWVALRLSWVRGKPRIKLGARCGDRACPLPRTR